ncbi:MAG: OmpH family outer membrane protein [Phycisphaerales bacterium]|nr:OmpH family outer membrane protein [Phycisphaerales bacterium]
MSKLTARLSALALGGAIFAFATYGSAQPAASSAPSNTRIAVVNLHRIFDETRQIADLNGKIKQQETDFRAEAQRRKEVIETKQTELVAFRPGTPDYESRRKDLVRLNIESNVWLQTTESELERMKFDWTQLIYEKAIDVARQIGNERGFDAVLQFKDYKPNLIDPNVQAIRRVIQERDVIFHRAEIDITDEVIRRMDQSYQSQPRATSTATPMGNP